MASACLVSPSPSHPLFPDPNPNPNPNPNPPSSDQSQPSDFEFSLHHPVAMLTADELFSDGKLVPLHLHLSSSRSEDPPPPASTLRSEIAAAAASDSPKAPKCSSRWRDLLGLKKLKNPNPHTSRSPIRNILNRNPRSAPIEASQSLPLLRDSDTDSLSLSSSSSSSSSSRLSLSSDSSSSDFPRLSLDFDKPRRGPIRPRPRPARRQHAADAESPRMNSSGKVVFYSGALERSSSSPSSFNGGGTTRARARGMERSYSANVVRVSPVLNVPVCSLRGSNKGGSVFGFFSQKKEKDKEKESAKSNGSSKMMMKS